jgi:predicted transcriptional regulator
MTYKILLRHLNKKSLQTVFEREIKNINHSCKHLRKYNKTNQLMVVGEEVRVLVSKYTLEHCTERLASLDIRAFFGYPLPLVTTHDFPQAQKF